MSEKKSDDDMEIVWLLAVLIIFLFLVVKLMFIPYFWISAFLVTPIYVKGVIGGLIVLLLCLIPFGITFFIKKDLMASLKSNVGFLTFGVVYFLFSAPKKATTGFIDAVCSGKKQSWHWWEACPTEAASLMTVGLITATTMMFFVNMLWLLPMFAKLAMRYSVATTPPINQFKGGLDIEKYIKMQKNIYSHLKFYEKINPIKFSVYKGKYRLLDSPKRWIFSKKLVNGFVARPEQSVDEIKSGENQDDSVLDEHNLIPTLDPFLLEQEILLQLGEIYTGVEQLDDLEIILFSIFLPRLIALDIHLDDKTANESLKQFYADIDDLWTVVSKQIIINKKINNGEPVINTYFDPKYVAKRKAVVLAYENNPIFQQITSKHAFVRTILIETVLQLRRLGVAQASEFSWLLYFDRTLWAILNNIGRPSYFIEGLAPCMHHEFEKKYGGKLAVVDTQLLVTAIGNEVNEYYYEPQLVQKWMKFLDDQDESAFFNDDFYSENAQTIEEAFANEHRLLLSHTGFDPNNVPKNEVQPNTGSEELDKAIKDEMADKTGEGNAIALTEKQA